MDRTKYLEDTLESDWNYFNHIKNLNLIKDGLLASVTGGIGSSLLYDFLYQDSTNVYGGFAGCMLLLVAPLYGIYSYILNN